MDRLLILRQISLFKEMSLGQLNAIDKLLSEAQYLHGELIIREGEVGTMLFLLIKGKVDVIKNYGTPEEKRLTTLEAISYFGEMAILDDEPRSATIAANGQVTVLCLDGEAFKELLRDMPDITFEVLKSLTQRIRKIEQR